MALVAASHGDAESDTDRDLTVEGEQVAFLRFLEPGDALRLTVATTDAGFNGARTSGGAVIDHASSEVDVPVVAGSTRP